MKPIDKLLRRLIDEVTRNRPLKKLVSGKEM